MALFRKLVSGIDKEKLQKSFQTIPQAWYAAKKRLDDNPAYDKYERVSFWKSVNSSIQ